MKRMRWQVTVGLAAGLLAMAAGPVSAHCDGLDGPVVTDARAALASGKVEPVLGWVPVEGEAEVRRAFEHAAAVRKLGPEAKILADTFFFETVVRVHRASEGAPYTGLKPAGRDLGPAIPAVDRSLETGSLSEVEKLVTDAVREGLRARFAAANASRKHAQDDVAAGRRYVGAYVPYVHYVEGVYEAATKNAAHGHAEAAGEKAGDDAHAGHVGKSEDDAHAAPGEKAGGDTHAGHH